MGEPIKHIRRVPPLPGRARDAHKGTFGRVLIIGGSVGMAGAPALAGLSALRSGAGLAIIAVPRSIQPTVAGLCPCATTIALPETDRGQIDPAAARALLTSSGWLGRDAQAHPPSAAVVGPGIGTGPDALATGVWELIDALRDGVSCPVVVDADALNLAWRGGQGNAGGWDARAHPRTIITPHPGELARMRGVSTSEIQSDREKCALDTVQTMRSHTPVGKPGPVVVLKGAGTIVTDGARVYINQTGNPGMATGGSGDVLSGVVAALLAQGMDVFDAAVTGVHIHGLAGDCAARRLGEVSLIATDIIDALPEAIKTCTPQRKEKPGGGADSHTQGDRYRQ